MGGYNRHGENIYDGWMQIEDDSVARHDLYLV